MLKLKKTLFKIGTGLVVSLLFSTCLNCSKEVFAQDIVEVVEADTNLNARSVQHVGKYGEKEYSSDVIDVVADGKDDAGEALPYREYHIIVNGAGSNVKLDENSLRKSCLDGVEKIKIDVKYFDEEKNEDVVISSQDLDLKTESGSVLDGPNKGQTYEYKYFAFQLPKKDLTKKWYTVDIKNEQNEKIGDCCLIIDWDAYNSSTAG